LGVRLVNECDYPCETERAEGIGEECFESLTGIPVAPSRLMESDDRLDIVDEIRARS
jgi:hypothetical protein